MKLMTPSLALLPSYKAALERGWCGDNLRPQTRLDELAGIEADAGAFVASLDDPQAKGKDIILPDGSMVKRLPGFRRWMWDGEFCGGIGLRWQNGTSELPPHVLGHIGYSVVPWKRRKGFATEALRQLLPLARAQGLSYVYITTQPDNLASQKVILSNGGAFIGEYTEDAAYGRRVGLKYRIAL